MFRIPTPSFRLILHELSGFLVGCGLFVVGPFFGFLLAMQHFFSQSSKTFYDFLMFFFGLVLLLVLLWGLRGLWETLTDGFGLRVTPRFQPPLQETHTTYFNGKQVFKEFQMLDRLAEQQGITKLSELGLSQKEVWFDCETGLLVLQTLLDSGLDSDVCAEEMEVIVQALEQGHQQGCQFRLEFVSGTAMNGMLWQQLREQGF